MADLTQTLNVNIQPYEGDAVGSHLLLTLRECSANILDDEERLIEVARLAAEATRATVLQVCSHRFSPQGVTVLVVLAESHASLHTYPEHNTVFWDCFTCGDTCEPSLSLPVLEEALKPGVVSKQLISRS